MQRRRFTAGGMVIAFLLLSVVGVALLAKSPAPESARGADLAAPSSSAWELPAGPSDTSLGELEDALLADHVAAADPLPFEPTTRLPVASKIAIPSTTAAPEDARDLETASGDRDDVASRGENVDATPFRVGIQAGHWRSYELPDELARLRTSTGTSGGGVSEWQLNLDIARRAAEILGAEGVEVDVLPATVPIGYRADAFVALHADGDVTGRLFGYKLARATRSAIPQIDDRLLEAISIEYGAATKLRLDDHISRNMTGYYAFSGWRLKHAIAPTTPAVILEMGFMTNASDRLVLLGAPEKVALGVAAGILRYLRENVPG